MDRWWRAGVLLTVLSIAAAIAMQAVAGQWFPPPVSVSQYGIGPWGWLFSVFVVTMSAAPLLFERCWHRRPATARVLLRLGLTGAIVMAVVRTDTGGAQASVNAKVHMVGSIFALGFVPLGMVVMLWLRGGAARLVGLVEIMLVEASITLLLCAAAGLDTAGLGPTRSWALWQAVASVLCVLMVVTLGVASVPPARRRRSSEDHTGTGQPYRGRTSILVQE